MATGASVQSEVLNLGEARRVLDGRKQRILVGTVEIGGSLPDFADAFRRLGHQVTTVIRKRHNFFRHLRYDVDINSDVVPWPSWITRSRFPLIRWPRGAVNLLTRIPQFTKLIAGHDVFVFLWGTMTLTTRCREFPFLHRLGKRIVCLHMGDDVRSMAAYCQEYDDRVSTPEFVRERTEWMPSMNPRRGRYNLGEGLHCLRMAERYSTLILSQPNQAGLALRPYLHLFMPIVLGNYRCRIPARDVPVVVHAPSSSATKGTHEIKTALQRLESEGVKFEMRLLQGASNPTVVAELENADVLIDQLCLPLHGRLSVEGMASGCAVATCNRQDYEPFPPNRPLWHIDRPNVYVQLKTLLQDKALRLRLATEGRQYVERFHDHVAVARRILDHVNHPRRRLDHYPTFFARRFHLPDGEVLPRYLKRLTGQIVQRFGLPAGVDPQDLIARGLMAQDGLDRSRSIPRW